MLKMELRLQILELLILEQMVLELCLMETSDLTATTVTVTSNNTGTLGKTAIFYKGSGTETKSINVAVNASALDKGTAVYAEDMNVVSSGTLGIGKDGIGIYVKGSATNTGTNQGIINLTSLKTGAVGMYTKTSNILNNTAGVINVNDITQVECMQKELMLQQ